MRRQPVSPLPFAFSRKIDSRPSLFFFSLPLTTDRSLPSRWPFVLIREISSELRVKKGKRGERGMWSWLSTGG